MNASALLFSTQTSTSRTGWNRRNFHDAEVALDDAALRDAAGGRRSRSRQCTRCDGKTSHAASADIVPRSVVDSGRASLNSPRHPWPAICSRPSPSPKVTPTSCAMRSPTASSTRASRPIRTAASRARPSRRPGFVLVAGEITTKAQLDFQKIVRGAVRDIGFTSSSDMGFDADDVRRDGRGRAAVARHRAGRRSRRPGQAGRGRSGPDVRLRVRRDQGADAAADPDGAPARVQARAGPQAEDQGHRLAAPRRQDPGLGPLRGRRGHRRRGDRRVDAARRQGQAQDDRGSDPRARHQADRPGEADHEQDEDPRQPDGPLRHRWPAGRLPASPAARSSSTPTAATLATAAARSRARIRARSIARPRTTRATSRSTSSPRASRAAARSSSRTRSASPSRSRCSSTRSAPASSPTRS